MRGSWQNQGMDQPPLDAPDSPPPPTRPSLRGMPGGIRIFLVYGSLILVVIGLSLRFVIDQAISAPVSPIGVVVMILLAYTIFTMTLVIQRKEAARTLALGLASLTLPAIPLAWLSFLADRPEDRRHAVRRGPRRCSSSAACWRPMSEPG